MRVMVIGGAGFVGRQLALRLKAAGHHVEAVVRKPTDAAVPGVVLHPGGMEDVGSLRRTIPRMDVVVHVASATTPGISKDMPSIEADLNISPTLRLLEVLHDAPDTRLIYMSSGGTVYGDAGADPAGEQTPLRPHSYYGAGKVAIEAFVAAFAHARQRRCVILRPSNLYGPGQPRYLGFGLVRALLQHAVDRTQVDVWGDGTTVRDFLYIDDLLEAFDRILSSNEASGAYNVSAGIGHSIMDLIAVVEQVTGHRLDVRHGPTRAIDVRSIVVDHGRLRDELGWSPAVGLREGITRTWSWLTQ